MITAEHIIGLTAQEHAWVHSDIDTLRLRAQVSVFERFNRILTSDVLLPRDIDSPSPEKTGTSFDEDFLAGDNKYVFASVGPRYRMITPPEVCYGFVFDAQQLVTEGALVGYDLMPDYESLLDSVAKRVDASLPQAEPMPMKDILAFMETLGESDPGMALSLQKDSTSHYWDILDGMREKNEEVIGVSQALALFSKEVKELQARKRVSLVDAIEDGKEILVLGKLPLSKAVGVIRRGQITWIKKQAK